MLNDKWNTRFLDMAALVASWSKDPSTKTGAVIVGPDKRVIATGYNGFPASMPDGPELYNNRAEKYSRIVHCEINAVLYAPSPLPTGAILYTWPFISCDRCVVQMLQAGIKNFVAPLPSEEALSRWAESFNRTRQYIKECGGILKEVSY